MLHHADNRYLIASTSEMNLRRLERKINEEGEREQDMLLRNQIVKRSKNMLCTAPIDVSSSLLCCSLLSKQTHELRLVTIGGYKNSTRGPCDMSDCELKNYLIFNSIILNFEISFGCL